MSRPSQARAAVLSLIGLVLVGIVAFTAPAVGPPWPETEVLAVCSRVLSTWTLKRWRESTSIAAVGA